MCGLYTVALRMEAVSFIKVDLDINVFVFEKSMYGFFKGDFRQYFTLSSDAFAAKPAGGYLRNTIAPVD